MIGAGRAFPRAEEFAPVAEVLTIVAMGTLTNIALALQKRPDAVEKIEQIIVMGGAIKHPGNVDKPFVGIRNSVAEWNFYLDLRAAERRARRARAPRRHSEFADLTGVSPENQRNSA